MEPASRQRKRIAILQSNYVPWKGYFNLVDSVDEFVLLDSVQYTRGDWRNRNRIKSAQGLKWLSIPIQTSGKFPQLIEDARTSDENWPKHHWRQLWESYRRAPAFEEMAAQIEPVYASSPTRWLSEINEHFLTALNRLLGISTVITRDHKYLSDTTTGKTERLVEICQRAGAAEYVSGPAARAYLDEEMLRQRGIGVTWFEYPSYPEYGQLHPPFAHAVTVLDVLFHLGGASRKYILTPQPDSLPRLSDLP